MRRPTARSTTRLRASACRALALLALVPSLAMAGADTGPATPTVPAPPPGHTSDQQRSEPATAPGGEASARPGDGPSSSADSAAAADPAAGGSPEPAENNALAPSVTAQDADDDMVLNPAQPDFTLVTLPTSLRLPRFKWAFRVTHRFTRSLSDGDFGSLLEDFFGFDGGAQIGLEVRVGLWDGWQAGIYRTSDRTIQFFTQYSWLRQTSGSPVNVDAWLTAEGTNNFRDSYSPGIGAVVSRTFGATGAVYAMPMWINNTAELPAELVDDNSTFVLGLGGRLRIRPTLYVVGEVVPRLSGYGPGDPLLSFAIEKRVGGHAFQINFSNSIGTTMAQAARSYANNDDWFIGFNITRKFF